MNNTAEEMQQVLQFLQNNLPEYCAGIIKIRNKDGETVPLNLNKSQLYVHNILEKQRKEKGYVKAIILKGRQQGISTYICSRFFHQVALNAGKQAMILAHTSESTNFVFNMMKKFYANLPDEMKPQLKKSNSKEIFFDILESGIRTATAGGAEVGRGSTNNFIHFSELAFYDKPENVFASALQSIPRLNSEVIIESTANGLNYFKKLWDDAVAGANDFIPIFLPWYWQDEYTIPVPSEFSLEGIELELMGSHKGLGLEHLQWRREKIRELGETLFRQEYPLSANEAFIESGESFISPSLVTRASNYQFIESELTPLILSVDVAGQGADKSCFLLRRGRKVVSVEYAAKLTTMEVVGRIVMMLRDKKIARVFIDANGIGAGCYDRLVELGYGKIVKAVVGQGTPFDSVRYYNKRAENWGLMRDWFEGDIPVSIPADQKLIAEICTPGFTINSSGKIVIESKDDIKKRGGHSPDGADALAMSFAEPVFTEEARANPLKRITRQKYKAGDEVAGY